MKLLWVKLVEGSFKTLTIIISSSYKLSYHGRQIKLETLIKGASLRVPAVINRNTPASTNVTRVKIRNQ